MNYDNPATESRISTWQTVLGIWIVLYLIEIVLLYVYARGHVANFWPRFYAWRSELEGALVGSGIYFIGLGLALVLLR